MRKLLIATDGFLPRWDGISSFINEILPRLQDTYSITVLAPNFGEYRANYKAKIIRFRTLGLRLGDNYKASLVNPRTVYREVKKADAVWIQCLGPLGIAAALAARHHNKKLLLYNHMIEWEVYPKSQGLDLIKMPLNFLTRVVGKYVYNLCDVIMVPSAEHAELLSVTGVRSMKKVVHLSVDISHYRPPPDKAEAKQKVGISPSNFVIGYAGRVSYEKDIKTLYRAFLRFVKKYPDSTLLIAGGGHPDLERMLAGNMKVVLTGLKDDLGPYYQAMDVYVLPSLVETTSLTTMEAMSTGLAVIVTPVGYVKEYVNNGSNGLFFSKQNSYALFNHLEYLKHNPQAISALGTNARETIKEHYSWDKTTQGIRKVIDALLPVEQ